jgi:hypothetical protein
MKENSIADAFGLRKSDPFVCAEITSISTRQKSVPSLHEDHSHCPKQEDKGKRNSQPLQEGGGAELRTTSPAIILRASWLHNNHYQAIASRLGGADHPICTKDICRYPATTNRLSKDRDRHPLRYAVHYGYRQYTQTGTQVLPRKNRRSNH